MHNSQKLCGAALLAFALTLTASAQKTSADAAKKNAPNTAAAPQTFKAKYEGGLFGYNKTQEGTLSFDDANFRLVFRDKSGKEVFVIPYDSITQEFADTQSKHPKSASVLGNVPLIYAPNPIGWIKTKNPYVTLQFSDPNTRLGGITSFRVESREICAAVVQTLADKAGLVQHGEIFVRPNPASVAMRAGMEPSERPAVTVENEMLSSRVISLPRPVYPQEARQQKVAGIVRVLVTVDNKGNVSAAEAVSGSPLLQAAAVDAAKQARFEPISRGGRPTKTIISYNFPAN
jgi:TonB family protein